MRKVLPVIGLILLLALWWWAESPDQQNDSNQSSSQSAGPADEADLDGLPPQVQETLDLVDAGGPFPYDRDGVTFQNREGLLPDRPNGYYREYTVPTPGEDDRGARRLVVGEAGEVYYTGDHYQSFELIRESQNAEVGS